MIFILTMEKDIRDQLARCDF